GCPTSWRCAVTHPETRKASGSSTPRDRPTRRSSFGCSRRPATSAWEWLPSPTNTRVLPTWRPIPTTSYASARRGPTTPSPRCSSTLRSICVCVTGWRLVGVTCPSFRRSSRWCARRSSRARRNCRARRSLATWPSVSRGSATTPRPCVSSVSSTRSACVSGSSPRVRRASTSSRRIAPRPPGRSTGRSPDTGNPEGKPSDHDVEGWVGGTGKGVLLEHRDKAAGVVEVACRGRSRTCGQYRGTLLPVPAQRVQHVPPDASVLRFGTDVHLGDLPRVAQVSPRLSLLSPRAQRLGDHVVPPLPGGAVEGVGEADRGVRLERDH